MKFAAKNKIKAMEGKLFHRTRLLEIVDLKSNSCIDNKFTDKYELSIEVGNNCDEVNSISSKTEPRCEKIGKCLLGENCCQLTMFQSASRSKLKKIEHEDKNGSIDAISYNSNKKILYLLVDLSSNFGNLIAYDASNCAVRAIFKSNFELLSSLKSINLTNNQISVIMGDLYHMMPLETLDLCN